MADLTTTFVGLNLRSPVIIGACPVSRRVESIQAAEEAGAGAIVIYSLFQEQIELETKEVDEALAVGSESYPEALTYFPKLEHAGPREHVMWVEKTRKCVKFPLIGSLNAYSVGSWVHYAKQLESAGCDALELNLYAVQTDPQKTASVVEQEALDVIASVKDAVSIPVAVKLSPFYTALANFASRVVEAGADGLVLFNRFYQPVIDVQTESLSVTINYSTPEEQRLPMRWIAILSAQLDVDFCASTGVHSGEDAAAYILAGAKAVQTASHVLKNGVQAIGRINSELSEWMDSKGYSCVKDFQGKLNSRSVSDPFVFERAHYINALLS
ncbi:MAG: dihydroorotate dehydrogenase-like protein [Armatimonadota bacterium]|nr:dihydroorotate dehydrogenase-like protein [Armatimonadota bacterium]